MKALVSGILFLNAQLRLWFPTPDSASASRPRKHRWPRILLRSAAFLLALLLVAIAAGVFWLRSAEKAALPQLDGELHLPRPFRPRHRSARRPRRPTHRRRQPGRSLLRPGLCHRPGPPLADGRLPPQRQRRARRDPRPLARPRTTGNSASSSSAVPPSASTPTCPRRPRPPRPLRPRRQPLHRPAPGFPPRRVPLLVYHPEPWTGVDSLSISMMMVQMLDTHWEVKLAPRAHRRRTPQSQARGRSLPRRLLARPSAHRRVDRLEQAAPAAARPNDEDDDRTQASLAIAPRPCRSSLRAAACRFARPPRPARLRRLHPRLQQLGRRRQPHRQRQAPALQ